jgi:transcriptional regulator with XRE-family HTH domain
MYRDARKKVGLSIEEASFQLHIAPRTLCKYEAGETLPPPGIVLAMCRLYCEPWMTQIYCQRDCAIGRAYSYEVLDRVNLDPASILLKLVGELKEAEAVLGRLLELAVNKNTREDFSQAEWSEFVAELQEFLDVEHNIETFKISLGRWCNVSELIQAHNQKCCERGYASKEKAALREAAN